MKWWDNLEDVPGDLYDGLEKLAIMSKIHSPPRGLVPGDADDAYLDFIAIFKFSRPPRDTEGHEVSTLVSDRTLSFRFHPAVHSHYPFSLHANGTQSSHWLETVRPSKLFQS